MYELYQNLVPPFIIKRIINSQFYKICMRPSLSGFQLGNSNVVNTILHDGPVHESASSVSYNNPIVFEVNVSVKQLYANPTSFSVAW